MPTPLRFLSALAVAILLFAGLVYCIAVFGLWVYGDFGVWSRLLVLPLLGLMFVLLPLLPVYVLLPQNKWKARLRPCLRWGVAYALAAGGLCLCIAYSSLHGIGGWLFPAPLFLAVIAGWVRLFRPWL